MENKEIISNYMSNLAKKSHEKNPRPKEYYQKIANKRWAKIKEEKEQEEKKEEN